MSDQETTEITNLFNFEIQLPLGKQDVLPGKWAITPVVFLVTFLVLSINRYFFIHIGR